MEEQDTNEIITSENAGAQERLLGHDEMPASDNPQNLSIISDSTPSAGLHRSSISSLEALPGNSSTTARPSADDYTPMTMWNPMWLHKGVLFGFCALFTALFVALVLLYNFSNLSRGLSTHISRNEYSWTYGPTAGKIASSLDRAKPSS